MKFDRPIIWTPRPNAGFILPGSRFLEFEPPKPSMGITGRYKIVKHRKGTVIQETPWFDNLILDSGLNRWGTGDIIAGAAIGTGTSTPAAGQVGLQSQTLFTTTGVSQTVSAGVAPNYNNSKILVYRTPLGGLNGNYSEVGVGWASGNNMFSRALILDGVGSPTTIAVGLAEQLDIYYQLSIYPPIVDITNNVTISGVNYTVTGRASVVTNTASYWGVDTDGAVSARGDMGAAFDGNIGLITGNPSGTGSGNSGVTVNAYSNNSLTRTCQYPGSLAIWNFGTGIKSTLMQWIAGSSGALAAFQYQFSPTIPKDNTKTLVLDYSVTWARKP